MNQLVSVVIPIYKVEKYLNRCVGSVVDQTYKNLEIILVDDGSPDRCPEMCDEWVKSDSRIKVVHKENAGLGMARNTGLDNATGEYICFFDSDDYVDPTTIEKCVATMLRDDSDVAVFGCVNDYGERRIPQKLDVKKFVFEGKSVQEELIPSLLTYGMGFGISCCMKFFKTAAINDNFIRFHSEREIISEDTIFILELLSKVKAVSIVAENLYYYCKNEGSLTTCYRSDRQAKNDDFVKKALVIAADLKLPKNVQDHIMARYHMYSVSAMKQILCSELPKWEKDRQLMDIFRSPILRKTLGFDVLGIHKKSLRLFFTLLRFRCYRMCKDLLCLKMKNS